MRESRLFQIVYCLLARGKTTAPELAARFEVSTRTIYRDLDALSAAGVPVFTVPGKGGGVALMEGYALDKAIFSAEERTRLLLGLKCLPEQEREKARALSEKLSALFQNGETDWLEVDLSPWGDRGQDSGAFQIIKEAILQRHILSFSYCNAQGCRSQRRVCPVRLLYRGSAWYLQAFCLNKNAYRTFRLSRMEGALPERETFGQLPSPSVETPLPDMPPLLLRFCAEMAPRVYEEFNPLFIQREPDDNLLVLAPMPDADWLYGYLLSFGGKVQVVSPLKVRQELMERAYKIAEAYL